MKHSPYLNYVRSFEAAARHLSFTAAAEELNYTQSAISNHVRSLEEFIGRPLFVRFPRSLSLTEVGEAYLPSIRHALTEIEAATASIINTHHEKKVAISCPMSLAQNWLAQAIAELNIVHPDLSITIHGTIWNDVEPEIADIRLTSERHDNEPHDARILWREKLAIVCAPDFQISNMPVKNASDIKAQNLINILGRSIYWQSFTNLFDIEDLSLSSGPQTNSVNVAMELAANGRGCALVPKSLIETYVTRGLLIEPFTFELFSPWSCYISNEVSPVPKHVGIVRNWLINYHR